MNTSRPEEREYVDRGGAADRLRSSKAYVDRLRARGELPYYKISSRKVLFRTDDLDQFIEKHRRGRRAGR